MTNPISIRRAIANDAAIIAQLTTLLGYAATTAEIAQRFETISSSKTDLLLVAVDANDTVIAWLQAHAANLVESGFRVEIVGLIVSPSHRRRGVGRLLVDHAERWAREIGSKAVVVRNNIQRAGSHAFYPSLGYAPTKTQHVYRKLLTQ